MKIFIVLLLSSILAPAFATDFYGSAIIGYSQSTNSGDGITSSGNADGFMIGYDVNQYIAVETGYNFLFNSARLSGAGSNAVTNLSGYEIATLGIYPVNDQFSVFARLGYANYSSNSYWTQSLSPLNNWVVTSTSSPSGMIYGPGLMYKVNKDLNFKFGYNIYNLTGTGQITVAGGTNTISNLNGDIIVHNIYISGSSHF